MARNFKPKKKKLLLVKEAAHILRISEEYLRSLIRQKKIAAYKEGRRGGYRIFAEEIDNYINQKYRSADTQFE